MPSWAEALAACAGLKRLLTFDAGFVAWFDRSPAGALRSFGLALPVLPCFLVFYFYGAPIRPEIGMLQLVGATATFYALSWVMFPLLLIVIGRTLEREGQAIAALAFCNWFTAILTIAVTPLKVLAVSGLLGGVPDFIITIVIIGQLAYRSFAFRVLLGVGYGGAILLTLLDYILGWCLVVLMLLPLFQPLTPA